MHLVIFGRSGCPYCTRAKRLAEDLQEKLEDFSFKYIDIHKENISQADLEKTIGKPAPTVPQIFLDKNYIGGYTEFENLVKEKAWI